MDELARREKPFFRPVLATKDAGRIFSTSIKEKAISHIVTIKTELRDLDAIKAACKRMGLAAPVSGEHTMFAGKVKGAAVQLKDWTYPVVFDLITGQAQYDNFNGRWGDQKHMDAFVQAYAVEKCKLEARRKGYQVTERKLPNGNVTLEVRVP
jgi:hypothetical protein